MFSSWRAAACQDTCVKKILGLGGGGGNRSPKWKPRLVRENNRGNCLLHSRSWNRTKPMASRDNCGKRGVRARVKREDTAGVQNQMGWGG